MAIYQEQVMQIARDVAGFTMAEADVLRKAVGKKIVKLLAEQKEKFIEGCVKNGLSVKLGEEIFLLLNRSLGMVLIVRMLPAMLWSVIKLPT